MNDRNKQFDAQDTGAYEKSHRDREWNEYQTNDFQSVPLGAMLDEGQGQAVTDAVQTASGEEMWLDRSREMAIDRDVDARPTERVPEDTQSFTLAQQEMINGEVEELESQFRTARRAEHAGYNREAASAAWVEAEYETHYKRQGPYTRPEPTPRPADPFAELSQDELGAVNQSATRLASKLGEKTVLSRSQISRLLAERVLRGQDPMTASLDLFERLKARATTKPLGWIDPWNTFEATVEVEVSVAWWPSGDGQAQAGWLEDDTGGAKFVVWQKSGRKPVLRKGDRVRIEGAKVSAFRKNGSVQTVLAVVGDTKISHLERGDGKKKVVRSIGRDPRFSVSLKEEQDHSWVSRLSGRNQETPDDYDERKAVVLNAELFGRIPTDEAEQILEAWDGLTDDDKDAIAERLRP